MQSGFTSLTAAAEPFSLKRVTYKVGPLRYSFDSLEREYGSGDASCKAALRFHLHDLRRLRAAMCLAAVIDTGEETVPSEEALLVMLKCLAYPATLVWPCGRSPYALSRPAAHALGSLYLGRGFTRRWFRWLGWFASARAILTCALPLAEQRRPVEQRYCSECVTQLCRC